MSDIGSMVAELIEAGCSPDVAAQVVARAYVAGVSSSEFRGSPVDKAAEKRREYDRERKRKERNSTGLPPDSAECPNTPLSSSNINRKRGERLPPEFQPDRDIAKQLGWSESQIDNEIENFRDYWIAKPGSGGCKLDWPATWRKWVRSSKVKPASGASGATPSHTPAADIDWKSVLSTYKKTGHWSRWAGPDPDTLACKAPPDLLREFGLLKSA